MSNERQNRGSDFGSGDGSDSGSASGRSASGNSRSTDGNGRNVDGNSERLSGNDNGTSGGTINGGTRTDNGASVISNEFNTGGNQNTVDETGSAGRGFGSAVADRVADSSDERGDTDRATFGTGAVSFGLGKKQRGRPRTAYTRESKTISLKESRDLVSVFVGSIFDIPAILLKADFWRLSADENELLTNAVIAWIDSLPKSQSNKFTKWIAENLPLLNFAMVALFIVGDRVKRTMELTKLQKGGAQMPNQQTAQQAPTIISTPLDAQMSGNFH